MGLIKPRGSAVWDVKKPVLHGSEPVRGMAKWGGQARRLAEKPVRPPGPGRKP